ncbi:uncharacterized protein ACNLHF_022799, partial [Anomaloglossus baeobatrachus]
FQATTFEDMMLSFSDEEWVGLAMWQRELYRTVMRDTMELATSLGYIYLSREELVQRDSPKSGNIQRENMIHVPELPVTQEEAPSTREPFISPYSEASAHSVILPCPKTTIIQKYLENSLTDKQTPISKAQKNLGGKPDSSDPETAFIHGVSPESKHEFLVSRQKTEVTPNSAWDSRPVFCGSSVDLLMEGDPQTTQDLLSDSEILTLIKVEAINVTIDSEITSLQGEERQIPPHFCKREESWGLQDGAVSPLPFNSLQDTCNYLPWAEHQSVHSPGTLLWTEQTSSGSSVEERGVWVTLDDRQMSTPEILQTENCSKCSLCGRGLLQSPPIGHHERLQEEKRLFICPACSRDQHGPPQQMHLVPPHTDGLTDSQSLQNKQSFLCPKCNRSFSQLVGLHRHQKTHIRNSMTRKVMAPPQRKGYRVPVLPAKEQVEYTETKPTPPLGESYSKLHHHLQLSTAFLQQLITSTCGFQYE